MEIRPDNNKFLKVFLAGSIEMGLAIEWQKELISRLAELNIIFYNPRRLNWDSTWVHDTTANSPFKQQVLWELENINTADLVVFYFDPNTTSPITLLELGLVLGDNKPCIVCCPEGYFRKGNVDITCVYFGNSVLNTLDELVAELKSYYATH